MELVKIKIKRFFCVRRFLGSMIFCCKLLQILACFFLFLVDLAYGREGRGIVSLAPNLTEWVVYLGQEKNLLGVTEQCDFPKVVLSKTKVGSYIAPEVEKILSLNPRLVLAAQGNPLERIDLLKNAGVSIHQFKAQRIADIPVAVAKLGAALDNLAGAQKWVDLFSAEREKNKKQGDVKINQIKNKQNVPAVLIALDWEPFYGVSKNTWLWDIFASVGFENVLQGYPVEYPALGLEQLSLLNPDIIIAFKEKNKTKKYDETLMEMHRKKVLKIWGNSKNRVPQIIYAPEDILVRPGPRLLEALSYVYQLRQSYL